jgi:acyl-CoA synthetase (AMP-forming)/AMP-acid ligase II
VLIEVLRAAAATHPARPFLVGPRQQLTYADALDRAEAWAGGLRAHNAARFAIQLADPADTVVLLCAASAVGAEPCTYSADLDADAIAETAKEFDHALLVSDRVAAVDGVTVVEPDRLRGPAAGSDADAATATVLILTTGTTGRPKGARHLWSRLLPKPGRLRPDTARWLLAYNLNQFAGIQVVLQALASHATLVIPVSNQPREALAAMREHRVTHASGTPTFWRFVCTALDRESAGELALEQITLGGEAVPEAVLDRLAELFPAARVSQVYASTEFGSTVSVRDGRHGLPLSVLDRGDDADVQFRIIDGELYARSRVGMVGYHGQQDVDDDWRPTGDLVEVRDDRIEFVGRTSEVINVGGVKVHPLPIEALVSAVDGVEMAHVYGRANALTGQLVVVDVVAAPGLDHGALETAIRTACSSLPRAAQPRRVSFVEQLGIRENKIVRRSGEQQ